MLWLIYDFFVYLVMKDLHKSILERKVFFKQFSISEKKEKDEKTDD